MPKQSILIYPTPHKILKALISKKRARGIRTNQCALVEELVIREAKNEGINTEKFFSQ